MRDFRETTLDEEESNAQYALMQRIEAYKAKLNEVNTRCNDLNAVQKGLIEQSTKDAARLLLIEARANSAEAKLAAIEKQIVVLSTLLRITRGG